MKTTRCHYPHTNEDPSLEWSELYRPGGLHPIDLGQYIDSEKRFEVCHKSGYGDEFTEWFTRDHVQHNWKLVKVFTADESSDDHPELVLALALADSPTKVLEDNYIITPSESFWIDGPNGRHLCLVFPVLDHRTPKSIIYRRNPDELVNLCFQVGKAVAFLHKKGICHGSKRLHSNRTRARIAYIYNRHRGEERSSDCRHKSIRKKDPKSQVPKKVRWRTTLVAS